MFASPVNWPRKFSSSTREVISEEKTHIDCEIRKLSKKVMKCAYDFEMYFSFREWYPLLEDILNVGRNSENPS